MARQARETYSKSKGKEAQGKKVDRKKSLSTRSTKTLLTGEKPKCLPIADKGISTGSDFAEFMSALITDVVQANLSPQVANAAVNAGGKLLKVVEMRYKYGQELGGKKPKELQLATGR